VNTSLTARLMSTRAGTIGVGAAAAAIAAVILLVYLNGYRNSVRATNAPISVLVAKSLIPKGTSGTIIADKGLFQTASVAKDHAKEGALADPAAIGGRVALVDIYPGQQLTVADFSPTPIETIPTKITGAQRGIAISIDGAHGMIGHAQAGDFVDVYAVVPDGDEATDEEGSIVKLLIPRVLVLAVPGVATGPNGQPAAQPAGGGGTIVLRVKKADVPRVAWVHDHGTLWLALRPQSGAKKTLPQAVDLDDIIKLKPKEKGGAAS
jgi:Flp pilus assembly protein CpaB